MRPFVILLVSLTLAAIAIDIGCDDPTIAAIPADPTTSASFTGYGSQSVAADPAPAATPTSAPSADPTVTRYVDEHGQAWELRTVCNGTVCSKEWVRAAAQAGPVRSLFNRPRGGFVRRFLGRFGGRIFRRAAFCSSC